MTVSSSLTVWNATLQFLRYGIERKMCVIVRRKLATHNEWNCSVCFKFSHLCFCQILFELVSSWESYHRNKMGGLFIETQCIFHSATVIARYYSTVRNISKQKQAEHAETGNDYNEILPALGSCSPNRIPKSTTTTQCRPNDSTVPFKSMYVCMYVRKFIHSAPLS